MRESWVLEICDGYAKISLQSMHKNLQICYDLKRGNFVFIYALEE